MRIVYICFIALFIALGGTVENVHAQTRDSVTCADLQSGVPQYCEEPVEDPRPCSDRGLSLDDCLECCDEEFSQPPIHDITPNQYEWLYIMCRAQCGLSQYFSRPRS